jgi:hypothetical protein
MTIEDKELIENAAKAMGYEGEWCEVQQAFIYQVPDAGCHLLSAFNSLDSNADCAEMEAQLEIDVLWNKELQIVNCFNDALPFQRRCREPYSTDKAAARRRASTRVAATMVKLT